MSTATIINGKEVSARLKKEIKEKIQALGVCPSLHVVLVGNNQASLIYVRNKTKACEECGIASTTHHLDESVTEEQVLKLISELNADDSVDGILVQLPLPAHISQTKVIDAISPLKDVDGFHPMNLGLLLSGEPRLVPCTPLGIMKLIEETGVEVQGKKAVVIGRSLIVGKPTAILLLQRNATVTVCHSKTKDLPQVVGEADIVVAAIGKAGFVTGDFIKEGAIVIDVGINRGQDGKLCGDVDFESASKKASFITPVPGGVGPMTIACLMHNTLHAHLLRKQPVRDVFPSAK